MARTRSHAGSETGPPRVRTVPRRARASGRLVLGAALAVTATALALGAPAVDAAPAPASTRTLLSITDPTVSTAEVAATVAKRGGRVLDVYAVADALLVSLPAGTSAPAGTVAVSDVALHVTSLGAAASAADVTGATYRTTIDAPAGQTGTGVTVAVVDTGVADVADLAGRLDHVNVSGDDAGDGLGHGTFMAGLIAGDGSSSGGQYTGVAPGASILDVQVATADGTTSLSRVLAGLQAVANRAATDPTLKVVSLALSTGSPLPPRSDPLARALDRLWSRGMTVVVAAGNDGPDAGTVTSPGADPTLITVGSIDEHSTSARTDDSVSAFSSRGTQFGTQKPDLVAPGTSLISTRAPGSSADTENPQSRVGEAYFTGTGTSMSEAVTAGAAAVLLGTRSALTPDAVKRLLVSDAYRAAGLTRAQGAGAGGLDLGAAVADAPTVPLRRSARSAAVKADDVLGPDPADADSWAAFQQAWSDGDLQAVSDAWVQLSPQTRKWAATAFALALLSSNPGMDPEEYAAVTAMARSWATQAWDARSWATDEFVARSWAARSWAARSWAIDDWAARSWADSSFTARSWAQQDWSARSWADAQFVARSWAARSWAARSWAE
ncbi:MAG TPA: S8 family serine peptidase, partial [Candidatus Nanopelagicales bacterium]|nr:S8 family serine peptidase [Candidatus Nanopelagicales bacterium]